MFEGNDPLVFFKEGRLPPERALGILLLTMLVVTMLLHATGH